MGCFLPVICLDSLKVAMMKIFQFLFTDTEVPHCIFCKLTAGCPLGCSRSIERRGGY